MPTDQSSLFRIGSRPLYSQQGQAVVFVLALLGVVILSVVFLFRSGQLTIEKMELQNAADAAAYSATTLEARSLNFAAYTNRAMIGNEVAIGQMVGLLSFAEELTEVEEGMQAYVAVLEAIPVVGEVLAPVTLLFETIADAMGTFGETLDELLQDIAPVVIKSLSSVNEVYSVSQEVYHMATFAVAADTILQCLEDNTYHTDFEGNFVKGLFSPDDGDAQLSSFGLIALAGHLPSYVNGFSRRHTTGTDNSKNKKGMGRMAATIRQGRDPFSSGLRCSKKHGDCISNGLHSSDSFGCCDAYNPHCVSLDRGWEYGVGVDLTLFSLNLDAKSAGGSELRYKDKHFIWSAVDSAVMEGRVGVDIPMPDPIPDITFHKSLDGPLGAGTSQATGKDARLTLFDMNRGIGREGQPKAYGGAAGDHYQLAWDIAQAEIGENEVADYPYTDLRPYRGLSGSEKVDYPFEAPYFLVGVIRKSDALEKRAPTINAPYNLKHGKQHHNRVAAVAKSEVYFSRPRDLAYFTRKDKLEEKPNLFSPFWQSRLVQTSDMDRFLALALQQKIIWIGDSDAADIPGAQGLIHALQKFLDTIL